MPESRDDIVESARRTGDFDVIVVGGGINGIGVFRDLALQGLRVLLVERNDFCSGCSAAPSRMIHGGLRYLENGEFGLVRESLRERDALLLNAPHMVRPLPTTIPIASRFSGLLNAAVSFFGGKSRPAQRGALPVKIGLALYDWVTRKRRLMPTHEFRGAEATFARWPGLTPHLRFSATYYDAWISHPERLGLELVLDAARENRSAVALNYAEIARVGDGFEITDTISGERFAATARIVVNATGAWIDDTGRALSGAELPERLVSGTKGSHLILDNPVLHDALGGHMIFFENADGRVCIVFPYLGKVLAGSTDIRVDAPTRVRCEDDECDYILTSLGRIFPGIPLDPGQVVFSYSGIRPLPMSDHDFTGRISRGHSTVRVEGTPPQLCMVGGKWTTFRAFAEQTADAVLAELGVARVHDTLALPIGGGGGMPEDPGVLERDLAGTFGISAVRAAHLVNAYGTRARAVLAFCIPRPDDVSLDGATEITAAEIAFLVQHERALRLGDLVLRRTDLAITGVLNANHITRIGEVAAAELGWTGDRLAREVADLTAELETYYGVSPAMLEDRTHSRSTECA
ncbi:glycerol-3-phosphate dehydrogenase/oxidase [Pelagibacterium halotolerans]|uniref:glycerol-3-phosphate dehydrogenase/oxidase n=1 Tax=Pelagibacterium halotolerans TaxID=531813 RepID=UPI00384FBAE6